MIAVLTLTQSCRGWTDGTFYVEPGITWFFWYSTCQVRIQNRQPSGTLTYCWNDLRGVADYLAWNCDASRDAYGGYCLMNNAWDIGGWQKMQQHKLSVV